MNNISSNIGSRLGSSVGSIIGDSIGSNVGSRIGISMGSREIVLNFLYRILGTGLLIRCFGSNILCRTYYNLSTQQIVTLNMVRKIVYSKYPQQ